MALKVVPEAGLRLRGVEQPPPLLEGVTVVSHLAESPQLSAMESVNVVVPVSVPVVHVPPLELEKLVQVPLCGENTPLTGPFVIEYVISTVPSPLSDAVREQEMSL